MAIGEFFFRSLALLSIFGWTRLERMIGDFGGSVC
jgi:hypothetical protein